MLRDVKRVDKVPRIVQEEINLNPKSKSTCPSVSTFPNVDDDEDELRQFVFNTKTVVPLYNNVANANDIASNAQPFLPCQQKNYMQDQSQMTNQMQQKAQANEQLGTFSKCDYSKYGSLI